MTRMHSIEEAVQHIERQRERLFDMAIRNTDWNETAVLRIIHYRSLMAVEDTGGPFTIDTGEYEVERYPERAPPASVHTEGTDPATQTEVTTVTWPLLVRLAEEFEDAELLTDAARRVGMAPE